MVVIGLTGCIGSGKSTVLRQFKRLGAKVIDADKLAREVVTPGRPAWREIKAKFGTKVFYSNNRLNRKKLASIVFKNEKLLKELNKIIHPKVFEEERRLTKKYGKGKNAVVVVDAPMMIESGSHKWKDALIVVSAKPEVRLQRLLKSGRWTKSDIEKRMSTQMPLKKKLKYADYVIENNGTLNDCRKSATAIYLQISGKQICT